MPLNDFRIIDSTASHRKCGGGPEKKANYAFLARLCYYVIKNITAKKDWLFDFVVILSQIYMHASVISFKDA